MSWRRESVLVRTLDGGVMRGWLGGLVKDPATGGQSRVVYFPRGRPGLLSELVVVREDPDPGPEAA